MEGTTPVAGKPKAITNVAAIAISLMWTWLPWAIAGSNQIASPPQLNRPGLDLAPDWSRLNQERLTVLAMVETGCRSQSACRADRLVGRAGEVSRYQIRPAVWRQYHQPLAGGRPQGNWAYLNPVKAKTVAQRIMDSRTATFVRATGRTPSDFEWYVLWNAPGAFTRAGYAAHRLTPAVKERAQRFSNLLGSRPPHGRNNITREQRKA